MLKRLLLSLLLLTAVLNATVPTQENVTKLYVATFDRAPDAAGLKYWLEDSGLNLEEIAMSFFEQKETQKKYPAGTPTSVFVETVYTNLFNRKPDAEGLAYWIKDLDEGKVSRSVFILAVINGALGDDAVILDHKMEVGLYFVEKGLNNIDLAKRVIVGVTADPNSVVEAKKMIDGNEVESTSPSSPTPTNNNKTFVKLNTQELKLNQLSQYTLTSSTEEVSVNGAQTLSLAKENKDVVALVNEGGIPILLGRKFVGDSYVVLSLESSAEMFVLITPRFNGVQSSNPKELSKRIRSSVLFPQLVNDIKRAINNNNPCPLNPICNYKASDSASKIADALQIDDLYEGGN